MRDLLLHVPVNVGLPALNVDTQSTTSSGYPQPTKTWLLRPVPHGIRIAGLTLCGRRRAVYPALAMPQDLSLMQMSQLLGIQRLELWEAECPVLPSMPRLTQLEMLFQPGTGLATLPLPRLTMLRVLTIWGADTWPSLSSLSRLTRLSLIAPYHTGPTEYRASADLSQLIEVRAPQSCCCPQVLSPQHTSSHVPPGSFSVEIFCAELGLS